MTTRDKIKQLREQEERERLEAGAKAGHKAADHQPAEYLLPHPTFPDCATWAVGCICGQHARNASARMSTRYVWFVSHVKKLGLPRFDCCDGKPYGQAVYMVGAAKGLTWDQAIAKKIDINS